MPRVDAASARCFVYSYKEGVLARLAHDLKLEVRSVTVTVDDGGMPTSVRLDPSSIEIVCQMENGAEKPGGFSDADRRKILENLRGDVLAVKKHPAIAFDVTSIEPQGTGHRVRGRLSLHGRTRDLDVSTRREGDREVAEVTLHQPDYGIAPFSAMLGALKVKADVLVRFDVRVSDD